jgi:hypothetical protein
MLPVYLDCFSFVCLRLVHPMFPVSFDCFCFEETKNNPEKLAA